MMGSGLIAGGTILQRGTRVGPEWPPRRLAWCHLLPRGGGRGANVRRGMEYGGSGRGGGFWLYLGFLELGILFFSFLCI